MQQERQSLTSFSDQVLQERPHKNTYEFNLERGRKLTISSNFDNGNIVLQKQVTELHYRLEAVSDFKSKSPTPRKTWFHFWASAPKHFRIRFTLENVTIYEIMYEEQKWPKPVFRDERGPWTIIKDAFLTVHILLSQYREEVGLVFDHTFISESPVYFALSVPFSYNDNESYLRDLAFRMPEFVRFKDQVITTTKQNLNVHRLSITHQGGAETNIKPIVLITCRVHPGQIGSSYCLMGMIDFLTRTFSLQAHLLLQMFEFVIFPMVNPDGVYQGNYRMDLNKTNLNRVYNDPSPDLHPSIFAIRLEILKILKETPNRKIMFHFDLHSHSCLKSAFIYGNVFDNIVTQTQSTLFCKLLDHNSEIFRSSLSQFTERHMKMKDKGQNMTKEGCARVVLSKLANITYSYTVETSIFSYPSHQNLEKASNPDFQKDENSFFDDPIHQSFFTRFNTKSEMVIDNVKLGNALIVTILDILEKNPYSRIASLQETIDSYRKQISQAILSSDERFKLLDTKAYQKVKIISKISKQMFAKNYSKGWNFLATNKQLREVKWPIIMKWFQACPEQKKVKDRRVRTEADNEVNDFLNPKNSRKKVLNFQNQSNQQKMKNPSPEKFQFTSKNVVNLELPTPKPILPEIRKSAERSYMPYQNSKSQKKIEEELRKEEKQYISPSMQAKSIKQLANKESTKNSVLSFIHDQMQKMSSIKRQPVLSHRLGALKMVKKNSSKSLKILLQKSNENLKNKIMVTETCQDIIQRRKTECKDEKRKSDALLSVLLESKMQGEKIESKQKQGSSKIQFAKIKYSQIKKQNIIKQEINGSANIKLPELRNSKNNVKNLCIDTRMLTSPDQY